MRWPRRRTGVALRWAALTASVAAGSVACSLITSYDGFVGGDASVDANTKPDVVDELRIIDGPDGSCVCIGDIPDGWAGPVAISAGPGASGCADPAYSMSAFTGFGGFDAGPVQCGCACGPPPGAACPSSFSAELYDDNKCTMRCATVKLQSSCTNLTLTNCNPTGSIVADAQPGTGGPCTPVPSVNVPEAGWGLTVEICGPASPPPQGACSPGNVCAPVPGSPLAPYPCIWSAGDVPCPDGAYSAKSTYYSSQTPIDNRACSTCNCGAPTVTCTASVNGCVGSGEPAIPLPTTCGSFGGNDPQGLLITDVTMVDASCAPSAVGPTGSATPDPAKATTVCCLH